MRLKNKDIAEKLGISTTAVSLAINNRPGVSEETRRKVLKLINDNATKSYRGVTNANQSDSTILLVVHKKHGAIINEKPFFTDLVGTIQQEAMKQSYTVSLVHYMPGQDMDTYISGLKTMRFDGMIIIATEMDKGDLDQYLQLDVPIVLADSSFDLAEIDSVALDNQTAVFREVDYGVKMGHRNIGYLQSRTFINNFGHHMDGFMKGIREFGLDHYEHPIISLPCNVDGAYYEMKKYLEEKEDGFVMPTLFLSDLDYIAMGAMKALKEAGYRIPEDISIIGYDDVSTCEVQDPPLTTTRVNRMDIGRLAMQRLVEKLRNPGDYYTTTQVSSELILRSSVKKIN